jgi:4-hydroxy-3-polyprenylbenzoate decarboxylase
MLTIGSERYVPYAATRRPQELLTLANAILGQGQLSLAKYLFIIAREDAPDLDIHDIRAFFRHVLERFDPETDLHFQTRTTIDTLDYSAGMGLNAGSKVVVAAAGPKRRELATEVPPSLHLPEGFGEPRVVMPGVLAIRGPRCGTRNAEHRLEEEDPDIVRLVSGPHPVLTGFPLVTVVDDADFTARNLGNWLWVTFTRSDPASDIAGVGAFVDRKHWGCRGPVVIDARLKPHMPPPLEEDPAVLKRIDPLFARGGPLAGVEG